jgi:hypothetical protein
VIRACVAIRCVRSVKSQCPRMEGNSPVGRPQVVNLSIPTDLPRRPSLSSGCGRGSRESKERALDKSAHQPFARSHGLDLSLRAAQKIGISHHGVARVKITTVKTPPDADVDRCSR